MAKVITTELQHSGASAANITLDSSKNVTCENNLQVDGNVTVTGTLPADKLTGALPAISGANLTGVTGTLSFRNLIINGDMQVAQRGGSSTTTGGDYVADRFSYWYNGGTTTSSVETLTSGSPYDLGFRKHARLTNTANSTAANSYRILRYRPEAQDIATSGWNYTSASSYVTLSFWIRSSVAQTLYVAFHTSDGTEKHYLMSTGALSADTWTKVTKTIPGATGVQFDNDNGAGAKLDFIAYWGSDYQGSINTEEWVTYSGSARVPTSIANTWAGTNGATLDITGVQLEVGDTATAFEHRSYSEELARCQRYYYTSPANTDSYIAGEGSPGRSRLAMNFPVTMRANPTMSATNWNLYGKTVGFTGYRNPSAIDTLPAITAQAEL